MTRIYTFYIWLVGVTVASLLPSSSLDVGFTVPLGADKGIHSLMYMILMWLAPSALRRANHSPNYRTLLGVAACIVLYSLLLEVLQPLISARTFEWADILANTAGVLGGLLLWHRRLTPLTITSATAQKPHK